VGVARDTETAVRAVWRTLDPALRRDVDDAVASGRLVAHPSLATVAVWRSLRLRAQWRLALAATLLPGAALAVLFPGPLTLTATGVALLVPAWRLHVLHRAIDLNCVLANRAPQLTDRTTRSASELARHLALRSALRRMNGSDLGPDAE
jgi:hypothetical protein